MIGIEGTSGERGILLSPLLLSDCDAYTSATIPCVLCGLQANPIFDHSLFSFPCSLDFRVKRYQWYQSARSISRCICCTSYAVRVCAFACLKSTLSRIDLSPTSSGPSA
jgi:hypothetical protein